MSNVVSLRPRHGTPKRLPGPIIDHESIHARVGRLAVVTGQLDVPDGPVTIGVVIRAEGLADWLICQGAYQPSFKTLNDFERHICDLAAIVQATLEAAEARQTFLSSDPPGAA